MSVARKRPWRVGGAALLVAARVTPKSGRESVDGVVEAAHGPALKVRVRAAAENGEANRAVEAVVARWLGIAKGSVQVSGGGKSRTKTLAIAGDVAALEDRLRDRLAEAGQEQDA